jgi:hypothetical protein
MGEPVLDGRLAEAISTMPWVRQFCPLMPHEYAVRSRSPAWAWDGLEAMVQATNPQSYLAYFRGYRRPNRYWEAPDGLRYWRTGYMLNRCAPDSVEPLRRVDAGAGPILDWVGPPWAPNGCGIYEQGPDDRWWPTADSIGAGFQPCRACRRPRGDHVEHESPGSMP